MPRYSVDLYTLENLLQKEVSYHDIFCCMKKHSLLS